MADKEITAQTPTKPAVSVGQPATAAKPPVKMGPAAWRAKLRPPGVPLHADKLRQVHFDTYFAGAKFANKWEDEWPLLTEAEFTMQLREVANQEFGGHWPDGVHFTKDQRGSDPRPTTPRAEE